MKKKWMKSLAFVLIIFLISWPVYAGSIREVSQNIERVRPIEPPFQITGGGGAPIYALEDRGGFFHYVWVSVQRGRTECEVVDLEDQVRDRFLIE